MEDIKHQKMPIKERAGDFLAAASEYVGQGIAAAGIYLVIPLVVPPYLARGALDRHGIERDKQEEIEIQDEHAEIRTPTLRKRFNRSVRSLGNRITPWSREKFNYSLGDLLTEEVNFTRLGVAAGVTAPMVWQYNINSEGGEYPVVGALATYLMWPFSLIGGGIGGVVGGSLGYALDNPKKVARGFGKKVKKIFLRKRDSHNELIMKETER